MRKQRNEGVPALFEWLRKEAKGSASAFLNISGKSEDSCGAASEDSPRREPCGTRWKIHKPRQGRKNNVGRGILPPRRSSCPAFTSHSLRHGLRSIATPWLANREQVGIRAFPRHEPPCCSRRGNEAVSFDSQPFPPPHVGSYGSGVHSVKSC